MTLDLSPYDFIDLGSSKGGSLRLGATRFGGGRGLGVDLDPTKVALARSKGLDIVHGDATDLGFPEDAVRFVTMVDFLEHLPTLDHVERVIAAAARVATDFAYISHPSFEGKEQLESRGLCQCWWNWTGHKCHIRVADYLSILDRLGLRQYMIRNLGEIRTTEHPSVVSRADGKNQHFYDAGRHRPKPYVGLDPPLWRAQEIFIALRPFSADEWEAVTRPTPSSRSSDRRAARTAERGAPKLTPQIRQGTESQPAAMVDLSRRSAVKLATQWVREQQPAALVRFGEGEGRLLVADPEDPASMDVARNKIRRQTGLTLDDAEVLSIKAQVINAFDRADVIGIRGSPSFNEEHAMWVGRIEAALDERVAAGRDAGLVTHCLVNNELRDALRELVAGVRVSVISCRDLAGRLEADYGATDVVSYQVPSQFVMRDVDNQYEAAMHSTPIWPDFHADLRRRLEVREPGEVFLVGAGIFGKDLCIQIRDSGGIALDMGSTLDGLAGKVTRGPGRPRPYRAGP